jgi:UDP-glucose 4-epimerase
MNCVDVLVTGASGFIGVNLCCRLIDEGYLVYAVDCKPRSNALPETVRYQQDDLTNHPNLPNVDYIIHLAAHSQVQPIVETPSYAVENITMIQHVLEEATRMDAGVVHASSRDVYGNAITPNTEEVTADSPNGYAASKLGAEALANAYNSTNRVPVTSLRLANVYGPQDRNQRVIPIFISLADAGKELSVYGGKKILDFVHVDDTCDALISALDRLHAVSGETINIGSGTGTPLTSVADHIATQIDVCPGWRVTENRTGDVARYVSETDRAASLLEFTADITLEEGISATIEWYHEHPDILTTIRNSLSN